MNIQTFTLEIKQGKLIVPVEIEEYLSKCPDNVQVSLTIKSELDELTNNWNKWFEQVEKIEVSNNFNETNNYGNLLINKYKKQGLEL